MVDNKIGDNLSMILKSPTYKMAELDTDFLQSEELRAVRMELEYLKPELAFKRMNIRSTVIVFGGTQIVETHIAQDRLDKAKSALAAAPTDQRRMRDLARAERVVAKSHYYEEARQFAKICSTNCHVDGQCDYVIVTGGGPGVMEAANRGAFEAEAPTIGLNITLPDEQHPNPYVTPELCFLFHYFAMRKMHFLVRAKALIVFPGGFGTLDELFDALTLRQTHRMQEIPIILYGSDYWKQVVNFQFLADEGVIRDEHLDLVSFADSPAQAWDIIADYHGHPVKDI
ncbi:LOG family protein [Blastopirellula sp. J2-11]|uniref:LOG family protein n=1 Tax=Blastopirellula sp. J2-11 TaxID=2943192 RepID=UPI0021C75914|nr:LOG family protein [Blastopirellula sp. J2-11]UUO05288.1 LOG family protein [Blastopirellula sp. J2-11]